MKPISLAILAMVSLLIYSGNLFAAVSFDRAFGSHMVLQQKKTIVFSGKATPDTPVKVEFAGKTVSAKPNQQGAWTATFPALPANSKGQTATAFQKEDKATLDDILIGEVWIASGQSNMLWRLNQTPSGKTEIPRASNDRLRIFHNTPQVHTNHSPYTEEHFDKLTPSEFYKGSWQVSSPSSAAPCSAVAYYFGKYLQKQLGIPVGIIHSSLGGSEMAAWIPRTEIESTPSFASMRGHKWLQSKYISNWVKGRAKQNIKNRLSSGEPAHPYKPGFLYETGIEWITNLAVSGVIWYQGESDAEINDSKQNSELLTHLIKSWQKAFKQKELPFIMVQLPRINDKSAIRAFWPEFREVQSISANSIPGVELINTIDLGSTNSDVHPPEKIVLGERMANLVSERIYKKPIRAQFPAINKWIAKGNKIHLLLDNADGLKTIDSKEPACFEIAGGDGVFHSATATIGTKGIVSLSSPQVKSPKSARYCWAPFASPNLVNKDNLPLFPFNTNSTYQ